jgi:hypothetical protein
VLAQLPCALVALPLSACAQPRPCSARRAHRSLPMLSSSRPRALLPALAWRSPLTSHGQNSQRRGCLSLVLDQLAVGPAQAPSRHSSSPSLRAAALPLVHASFSSARRDIVPCCARPWCWPRAPRPAWPRPHHRSAARPNAGLGPALCSSSQSLRCQVPCRVPCRVCVVVFFHGNAHFVVVLRFLLGPTWVLVVGQARSCFLCLIIVVRSPRLDVGPYVLSPTCVRVDKSISRRCGEAIPWSMPQVLGERLEQESSPVMRSSSNMERF